MRATERTRLDRWVVSIHELITDIPKRKTGLADRAAAEYHHLHALRAHPRRSGQRCVDQRGLVHAYEERGRWRIDRSCVGLPKLGQIAMYGHALATRITGDVEMGGSECGTAREAESRIRSSRRFDSSSASPASSHSFSVPSASSPGANIVRAQVAPVSSALTLVIRLANRSTWAPAYRAAVDEATERARSRCCSTASARPSPTYSGTLRALKSSLSAHSYLEHRADTDFFSGAPQQALTTLSYSDNVDLQRSAALAWAEITEKDVREVTRDTLDPILFLLQSLDVEVQRAASAALGNLAVETNNKTTIVNLGGLEPLIRQMLSPNVGAWSPTADFSRAQRCNATRSAASPTWRRQRRTSRRLPSRERWCR